MKRTGDACFMHSIKLNEHHAMRTILVITFLSLLIPAVSCQEASLTATASPNVMQVGEQFNLMYTSEEELDELQLPKIENAELLGGPSQGHSQSVYSVNGKITTSSTYQYTYFLRATQEGKFIIPPASGKLKNKIIKSNPVNFEVLSSERASGKQNGGESESSQSQGGAISDKDIFVTLIPDKKSVYLGEQIVVLVKIYTQVNLSAVEPNFQPDFTGFFTEPLEIPALRNLQREAVGNEIYYTGVIRKVMIIPQKTGELTIQPFDLEVAIRQAVRRRTGDSFFDDFLMPDEQEVRATLKSKALKIQVKPLPGNAPASFNGAVGNFRFNASLSKTTAVVNEPLTLKYSISGKGNIKLINEINVQVPYDLEKYDPVINSRFDDPLSGTKTFEYMVVPKIAGTFTIPAVEFTYFDPGVQQYKSLKSQSFTIQVAPGKGDSLVSMSSVVTKEDVKMLNQDIRYIKNEPFLLHSGRKYMARSPWYYGLYGLALTILMLSFWYRNRIIGRRSDIAGMRNRKANQFARRRLRKSAELLKQGKRNAFYEELLGAIWGYMSDKLNIPVSSLSRDTAKTALLERSVDEDLVKELFRISGECEMARYGMAAGNVAMDKLYGDAIEVISMIQQKLK